MQRDQLDLRGLSLTELMAKDAEIGNKLDALEWDGYTKCINWLENAEVKNLLADRRQLRQAMEALRGQLRDESVYDSQGNEIPVA